MRIRFDKTALRPKHLTKIEDSDKERFGDIFGKNKRVAIPLVNEALTDIINLLSSGQTSTKSKYNVDLGKQVAYKDGDKRSFRLGSIILRELGPEFANEWSRQVKTLNDTDNVIIISRSPIDIVRMSDHSDFSSCHSPGDDYFSCAVQEAKTGGCIAYVVKRKDLEGYDLNEEELFEDPDRDIEGVRPLSRLRLSRYTEKDSGTEFLVPCVRTYGKPFASFYETVAEWARKVQPDVVKKYSNLDGETNLRGFVRLGGYYSDSSDAKLFNKFFKSGVFVGDAITVSSDDDDDDGFMDNMQAWQDEIDQVLEDNRDLRFFELDVIDLQQDALGYEIIFKIWFANLIKDVSYSEFTLANRVRDLIAKYLNLDYYVISGYGGQEIDGGFSFRIRFKKEDNQNGVENPDDLRQLMFDIKEADSLIKEPEFFNLFVSFGIIRRDRELNLPVSPEDFDFKELVLQSAGNDEILSLNIDNNEVKVRSYADFDQAVKATSSEHAYGIYSINYIEGVYRTLLHNGIKERIYKWITRVMTKANESGSLFLNVSGDKLADIDYPDIKFNSFPYDPYRSDISIQFRLRALRSIKDRESRYSFLRSCKYLDDMFHNDMGAILRDLKEIEERAFKESLKTTSNPNNPAKSLKSNSINWYRAAVNSLSRESL